MRRTEPLSGRVVVTSDKDLVESCRSLIGGDVAGVDNEGHGETSVLAELILLLTDGCWRKKSDNP